MNTPCVMFIGAGIYQLPGILRARELGYRTVAVDGSPDAPGLALADGSAVIDVRCADACLAYARAQGVNGVLTVASDAAVRSVAHVADSLGLPGISTQVSKRVTDKQMMREAFDIAGIRQPRSVAVSSEAEAVREANSLGYPVVVKPTDGAGSRGVTFVGEPTLLSGAYKSARSHALAENVLVEEFVEGHESSVEGFVVGGELRIVAMSDKVRTEPPYLLDRTVVFPSEFAPGELERIEAMAQDCVTAVGLRSGPIHLEYIRSSEGPVPVELAARGPGFNVFSDIIPFVSGVDVITAVINHALGLPVDVSVTQDLAVALAFIESPCDGHLSSVLRVEEARAVVGVTEVEIYTRKGDEVRTLASGADRIGHVIARGSVRQDVLRAAQKATDMIRVVVEP